MLHLKKTFQPQDFVVRPWSLTEFQSHAHFLKASHSFATKYQTNISLLSSAMKYLFTLLTSPDLINFLFNIYPYLIIFLFPLLPIKSTVQTPLFLPLATRYMSLLLTRKSWDQTSLPSSLLPMKSPFQTLLFLSLATKYHPPLLTSLPFFTASKSQV